MRARLERPAAVPSPLPDYVPRLFTVADLAVLPSELPSGTVLYELHHGRLITLPPHTDVHGAAVGNIAAALLEQGEKRGLGKARCGGVGVILARSPDCVVGVDAVFIANQSLPIRRSPEDYLETMPDLVVEVRERNDSLPALRRKADDYLAAGVRVVWVADPMARTVTEYRPGAEPRADQEDDTLTVEDVIPGFRLLVRDALQD